MFWADEIVDRAAGGRKQKRGAGTLRRRADCLEGGQFYWGEYGIAAGLPKGDGYVVEIVWRGSKDVHGTVACKAIGENKGWRIANRVGCSVQITKKGAEGAKRARELGGGDLREEHFFRVSGSVSGVGSGSGFGSG